MSKNQTDHDDGFLVGLGLAVLASALVTFAYATGLITQGDMFGIAILAAVAISLILGRWYT